MTPVQLALDPEVVAGLTPVQGSFLDVLQDALARLSPAGLDLGRSDVTLADGVLRVRLVHQTDPPSDLQAAVGDDEALVGYGPEQQVFDAGDPGHGNPWPFPAPDHGAAAAHLVEQLIAGRVRVRTKPGVLQEGGWSRGRRTTARWCRSC
ncbi:hypothetical protein B7486_72650, partial [cyanobacterium TDX16]